MWHSNELKARVIMIGININRSRFTVVLTSNTKNLEAGTYVAALIKWNNCVPTISTSIKAMNVSFAFFVP